MAETVVRLYRKVEAQMAIVIMAEPQPAALGMDPICRRRRSARRRHGPAWWGQPTT